MKITSISSRELLRTVTKSDFPGVSRENREILETGKLSDVFPGSPTNFKETTKDRFENSDSIVFDGALSVNGKKNTDRFEYSGNDDPDFNHLVDWVHNVDWTLSSLFQLAGTNHYNKEEIARHFGGLARQLDKLYEKGKCTKEEYDCLNGDIAERIEHYTACAEKSAARDAIDLRNFSSPDYAKIAATMTKAEYEAEVQDYIEKHCKIDRKALMQMFNNVRYGKLRPKEKSFVIKTSSAAAENEKNTDIIDKV